jgi:hypothetical protein
MIVVAARGARAVASGSGGQRLTLLRCRRTSAFGREAGVRRRSSSDVNGSSAHDGMRRLNRTAETSRGLLSPISIVGTRCSSEMIRITQLSIVRLLPRWKKAIAFLAGPAASLLVGPPRHGSCRPGPALPVVRTNSGLFVYLQFFFGLTKPLQRASCSPFQLQTRGPSSEAKWTSLPSLLRQSFGPRFGTEKFTW